MTYRVRMCPNLRSKIEYTQAGLWSGKALREGWERTVSSNGDGFPVIRHLLPGLYVPFHIRHL